MSTLCNAGKTTEVPGDGHGNACSIVTSQQSNDPGGWFVSVYCDTGAGPMLVRRFWLTAPASDASRLLARLHVPGARTWLAKVQAPTTSVAPLRVHLEAEQLGAPQELQPRTGKGLGIAADTVPATVTLPKGAWVQEASATADGGPVTVTIVAQRDATLTQTLQTITIPDGEVYTATFSQDEFIASIDFAGSVGAYAVRYQE